MAYIRKTIDRWDIIGNYGYGWDCECSEYTYKEAKQRLTEYRENGGGCYRLEKRREKSKYTEDKAETLLTALIHRELRKGATQK